MLRAPGMGQSLLSHSCFVSLTRARVKVLNSELIYLLILFCHPNNFLYFYYNFVFRVSRLYRQYCAGHLRLAFNVFLLLWYRVHIRQPNTLTHQWKVKSETIFVQILIKQSQYCRLTDYRIHEYKTNTCGRKYNLSKFLSVLYFKHNMSILY